MNLTKIFLICVCLFVAACSSTNPNNNQKANDAPKRNHFASDYEKDLIAPLEADIYILTERETFDEPTLGTMLRYVNKDFPEDNITLYVYPISAINWDNTEETINQELGYVLEEIDMAVNQGMYKSREKETKNNFVITHNMQEFKGVKSKLKIIDKNDVLFYSNTYLFILEDKFIKFRISFDSRMSKEIDGDNIVETLLPLIKVPVESVYMENIRADHREKMQKAFVQMFLENSR